MAGGGAVAGGAGRGERAAPRLHQRVGARPHPEQPGAWQILDGAHRREALQRLGHGEALVYPWACDDTTALLLLATLNRLQGADVPALRAQLLQDLSGLVSETELLALIPEDAEALAAAQEFHEVDTASLLAELEAAHARAAATGPRLISFAVDRDDEPLIEEAIGMAMMSLTGRDRRGRALTAICRRFLETNDA